MTREQEHARRLSDRLDFAREIHDRVIQRLFGVSLVLGADGALSPSARKRCRDELHAALTELRSALRRPLEMERPRVDGSLREALERAANGGQHAFRYDWQPGLSIPRPLERLARAVLAEALRNATKHAHPTAIAAKVAGEDGELVLTVRNDGVAPRRSRPDTGLGLRLVALEAIAARRPGGRRAGRPRRLGAAVLRTPAGGDMSESLRILVVDDHDVVHWGFRLLLSEQPWVERCFSARDGDAAVALARRHRPDVALVDLFTGDQSGIDICASVREASPDTSVLLISGAGQVSDQTARRAGAAGFVSKDLDAADVVKAVRMVALGMTVFTPGKRADARSGCRRASARCSTSSPRAPPTGRSAIACSSRGTRSRSTPAPSTASSACATAPRRSSRPSAAACWCRSSSSARPARAAGRPSAARSAGRS